MRIYYYISAIIFGWRIRSRNEVMECLSERLVVIFIMVVTLETAGEVKL